MELLLLLLILLLAIPLIVFGSPVLIYVLPLILVGLAISYWRHGRRPSAELHWNRRTKTLIAGWRDSIRHLHWRSMH